MTKEEFIKYCSEINIKITDILYDKLYKYYELLNEYNKKFNMTTITSYEDVFLLHFYDSLCINKTGYLNDKDSIKLLDFGTGAGFPGMVIAIIYSNINVTLIESNAKKCLFLNLIKQELKLDNINIVNGRVEEYSVKNREVFDIVTCRAVTSLPMIIEMCTSSIKVGGLLIPLKSNIDEEIKIANQIITKFNLELVNKIEYDLPITNAYRCIPIYCKYKITDKKYPRSYSSILKTYKTNKKD